MHAHHLSYGDNPLSISFLLPSSRNLFFLNQQHLRSTFITHIRTRRICFRICASSAKKPRRSNVKSNEELCNDIREFMSAVGLPEGHFPTMKEFSAHGRTDLANIVRRRGYRVVRDLLSNSSKADISGFDTEQNIAEQQDETSHSPEGQDEKVGNVVEDSSSHDISVVEDYSSSEGIDPGSSYNDHDQISAESSLDESSKTYNAIEDESLPKEVLIMVKFDGGLDLNSESNSDVIACLPEETSGSYFSEEKDREISKGQDEKAKFMADDVSMTPEVSYSECPSNRTNVVPSFNPSGHSFKSMDLVAANTSLEDKVAKFIQHGDLDTIEDDVFGTLDERTKESERFKAFKIETEKPKSPLEENFEHAAIIRSNAASALNTRKDNSTAEDVASSDMMKDVDDEISKSDNQVEINRLKFLLHQKEMELSHLKDQIEKEKLSLSDLQMRTETEMIKAQKFISEKEAELLAAEESLSGLVEVSIQYSGEGEIVEVAGSFNGWHQPIKMDPPPTGSRRSRLWSTRLWLYPGVYEIKFIVDGQWKVDEERESITKGGICNNILRVDG